MTFTRDTYINSPSPIEYELRLIFDVQKPLVIFDIGSCEGEDSIRYSRIFSNSRIFAVEALPSNLPLLKANLDKYSVENVEILPFALSDKIGTCNFYVSSGQLEGNKENQDWDYGNKSSSLLPPEKHLEIIPWLKFQDMIIVEARTLKDVCLEKEIACIDFIHMDVQGAELKVLEGAEEFIKQVKLIWLEVEAIELYKNQPLKQDIEVFMQKKGFFKIKDTVDSVSGDQLYINKNYLFRNLKVLASLSPNIYDYLLQKYELRKILRHLINQFFIAISHDCSKTSGRLGQSNVSVCSRKSVI